MLCNATANFLAEADRCFRDAYCLQHQGNARSKNSALKMETIYFSETLAPIDDNTGEHHRTLLLVIILNQIKSSSIHPIFTINFNIIFPSSFCLPSDLFSFRFPTSILYIFNISHEFYPSYPLWLDHPIIWWAAQMTLSVIHFPPSPFFSVSCDKFLLYCGNYMPHFGATQINPPVRCLFDWILFRVYKIRIGWNIERKCVLFTFVMKSWLP